MGADVPAYLKSGFYIRVKRGDKWITVDGIYEATDYEFETWVSKKMEEMYKHIVKYAGWTNHRRAAFLVFLAKHGPLPAVAEGSMMHTILKEEVGGVYVEEE